MGLHNLRIIYYLLYKISPFLQYLPSIITAFPAPQAISLHDHALPGIWLQHL